MIYRTGSSDELVTKFLGRQHQAEGIGPRACEVRLAIGTRDLTTTLQLGGRWGLGILQGWDDGWMI